MSATNDNTPAPTPKFNVIAARPFVVGNNNLKDRITRRKNNVKQEDTEVVENYTLNRDRKCSVSNCNNNYKSCQLFTFPNDKRLHQWKKLIGLGKGRQRKFRHLFVCAEHFKEEDFVVTKNKLVLSDTAIPSEKLPKVTYYSDIPTDFISKLSDDALKLDDTLTEIDLYKTHKGNTYNEMQLNFYISHPNAYKLLEKTFNLMEPLKLKQLLSKFRTRHEIITKKLTAMSPKQKVCILSHGKITMAPKLFYDRKLDKLIGLVGSEFDSASHYPADAAQFLVLSGVYEPWNILLEVAYFIEGRKISTKNWLGGLADKILGNALRSMVKVLILLPEFTIYEANIFMSKPIQNTNNKPFLLQLCDTFKFETQMVVLYDLQFLLKFLFFSLRRIYYLIPGPTKSEKVEVLNLVELLIKDEKKTCPLLPNLKVCHLEPSSFEELKFETILEVFSDNTVSAFCAYSELGLIPTEAIGMLIFIRKISSLLNIFKGKIQDHREVILILNDVEATLSKVKVFTVGTDINIDPGHTAISYLIITLKALSTLLVNDPELFTAVSKLLLNNYTNKFCERVREKCGGVELTAKSVNETFRSSAIDNLLKPLKQPKVNLNEAMDLFIDQLRIDIPNTILKNNTFKLEVKPSEYKIHYADRSDKFLYIAGYLLKKCADKHSCENFTMYLENTNNYNIDSLMFDVANGNCLIPKSDFMTFIELLEMVFIANFPKIAFKNNIIQTVIQALKQVEFLAPCSCFPINYMLELFVLIRIDHIIKCTNLEVRLQKKLKLDPVSIFLKI